jgi:hypothetical protein
MFVELVYDKRNFDGLPGAKDIILGELTKRVHRIFPDADVRVKPMMTLPAINTDASKHEKEQISRTVRKCLKRLICGWFQIKCVRFIFLYPIPLNCILLLYADSCHSRD